MLQGWGLLITKDVIMLDAEEGAILKQIPGFLETNNEDGPLALDAAERAGGSGQMTEQYSHR